MGWQIFKPSNFMAKLRAYNALPPLNVRVLQAIHALGPECSSVQIGQHLEDNGGRVSIVRLHLMLALLEEEGEVTSAQRPGGAEREYYLKSVYWLTGHGLAKARVGGNAKEVG